MNLKKLLFAAVIVLSANASFAQDTKVATHNVNISIPEFALMDLESGAANNDITLLGTAPTEAGEAMTFGLGATNSKLWLNYSAIVGSTSKNTSRTVSVKITTGDLPAGLKLTVLAGAYSGVGKGHMGTPETIITLNKTVDQPIVSGIKSAYTGNGTTNGHNLTYQLGYVTDATNKPTEYALLDANSSAALIITYTLSDIQ